MASSTSFRNIARRYVTALFSLSEEKKAQEAVAEDLEGFAASLAASPELERFIGNPLASRVQQRQVLEALLRAGKANALTARFMVSLADARRLTLLPEIARQFREMLTQQQNQVTAEVTSAAPLGKQQQSAIVKALAKVTGKDIRLELREDPRILGGLVVRVGGKMIDSSLAGKLARLQTTMKTRISQY